MVPSASNHFRAVTISFVKTKCAQVSRTREASNAVFLSQRLASTVSIDFCYSDFILCMGKCIRQLLIDGSKVLCDNGLSD